MMRTVRWNFVIAALGMVLVLPLWGLAGPSGPRPGGQVAYAVNIEPQMLDVHVGSSRYDRQVTVMLYDQLIFLNRDGKLMPWLAEAWQVSPDLKTFTFKLRQGVTYHDGTPFNAASVKATFDRIVDPRTKSTSAIGLMGFYKSSEVVDPYTVRVRFEQPHPGFLLNLTDPTLGMQSPAAVARHGANYARNPVGTGPFQFREWVTRNRIVLVRNPNYRWGPPGAKHTGPAYLEQITYRIIPEDGSRLAALQAGQIDGAMRIAPQFVPALKMDKRFRVINVTLPGTGVILTVNVEKPPTNDLAFRKALAHAISIDETSRVGYFDQWWPHRGSVLSPGNPYFKDVSKMYPFDLKKAEQILDEAGWRRGPDGIRARGGVRARIQYIGFPAADTNRVMQWVGANLRKIGIEMEIRELESGAIHKARQAGEHNIAHLTFIFNDPAFLRTLFHSENIGSGWNFVRWRDKRLDDLLVAGEIETDQAKRKAIYEEIQTRMREHVAVIPTAYQHQIQAFKAELKDVSQYPVYGEYAWFYDAYWDR